MDPPPEYLQHRIELFDKWKKEADEEIASKTNSTPILFTHYLHLYKQRSLVNPLLSPCPMVQPRKVSLGKPLL